MMYYVFTRAVKVSALSVTLLKSTRTCHTSCSSLWHSNKHLVFFTPLPPSPLTRRPAEESLLSHTAPPHWSRTVTCPTPTCSLTLRTSQYLFNHFIGRSYRPEPLWKHSSVCSFVFKKNTIQQLSKIHAVWSDYSLIYKISFLTFNF